MAPERSAEKIAPEPRLQARAPQARAVAARLAELLGEELEGELTQLSSGASRATFAFATAAHGRLVLQMDRQEARAERSEGQAALLAAAARAGVPVAAPLAHGQADPVLGPSWIVARAVEGSTDPSEILAPQRAGQESALIDSIAAALAAVHRMPPDPDLVPAVEDPIAQLREQHDALGQPHPVFELAFRVLGGDRPPARRTFVHGDFRLGNLMVLGRRVSAVLDWELAHVGDPLEDLGWLCVPAWRFTRPDRPAAGLGTREQLAAAYERHAGVEVDRDELGRWELAGTLRWGVICEMQAFAHLSGAISSLEHAVIGRRACEVEWDLLEMLDHQADSVAQAAPARAPAAGRPPQRCASSEPDLGSRGPGLHDRPTVDELLAATRGALGDGVLPLLDGRAAFELRVALRALGMVRRELSLAHEHACTRDRVLERLGAADERALAEAIRAGALDGREREACAALRETVRAKLEVANPRYLNTYAKEG
jgi:aminoglycoside phosphotransferase (APT) family kinase protein